MGLWGTLGLLLYGIWMLAVAWHVRTEVRIFASLAAVGGLGALAYRGRTGLSGRTPVELAWLPDLLILGAVGLTIIWAFWLAARLLLHADRS